MDFLKGIGRQVTDAKFVLAVVLVIVALRYLELWVPAARRFTTPPAPRAAANGG